MHFVSVFTYFILLKFEVGDKIRLILWMDIQMHAMKSFNEFIIRMYILITYSNQYHMQRCVYQIDILQLVIKLYIVSLHSIDQKYILITILSMYSLLKPIGADKLILQLYTSLYSSFLKSFFLCVKVDHTSNNYLLQPTEKDEVYV